jgi:hypothetical protein
MLAWWRLLWKTSECGEEMVVLTFVSAETHAVLPPLSVQRRRLAGRSKSAGDAAGDAAGHAKASTLAAFLCAPSLKEPAPSSAREAALTLEEREHTFLRSDYQHSASRCRSGAAYCSARARAGGRPLPPARLACVYVQNQLVCEYEIIILAGTTSSPLG